MSTTSTDDIRQAPGAIRERPPTIEADELDLASPLAKKAKTEESNEEEGESSEEEETTSTMMTPAQMTWALFNLKPEDLVGVSDAEAAAWLPSYKPPQCNELPPPPPNPSQYDAPGDDDIFADMTIDYPEDLTKEQGAIWMAIGAGKSVFFTGAAGAGKSHLLRKVIAHKKQKLPGRVFVTAPTGVAACNVGGTTIHQFAGIGLGDKSGPAYVAIIRRNREAHSRWNRAEVLIIDEISMVSAELFDKLNFIAQHVRDGGMHLPFGGLQVIVCGDFFQLPPVIKEEPKFVSASQANYDSDDDREFDSVPSAPSLPVYCFESASWATLLPMENQFTLTKIYRQADEDFVDLLNNFRIGSSEGYMGLLPCIGRQWHDRSIVPTQLYPHRRTVQEYNDTRLAKLGGQTVTYKAEDSGTGTVQEAVKLLNSGCSAQETLVLKVGAEVILLRNLDFAQGLCNGARGRVVRFVENESIEESAGEEKKKKQQQQQTKPIALKKENKLPPHPVVKFDNGVESTIIRDEWDITLGDKVIATRVQIPLALAWAITIHKSQGMTISYLEVDLQGVFAAGQAYVALSRATSLEGLRIKQMFDKSVIRADAKVIAFYRQLANKGRAADDQISENELDSDDDY
jgi:ATP-dependent DNA helicase PIF1